MFGKVKVPVTVTLHLSHHSLKESSEQQMSQAWESLGDLTSKTGSQAGRRWVPFLKSLVSHSRESNPRPTILRANTLPLTW